ncbi:MAG: threonylcarbamoyl-AMP synthase [Erysipelotrichaceae bacterium]|nr:threonylcarbamoyl-AMP synthase [Erysipelotrichaceae bacterium]
MRTIRYTKMDKQEIINILMTGGILAFPTDTVFGLACAMDRDAMKKVYKAKGRDFRKPLPVMCDGPEMIRRIAYVSQEAEKIMDRFMPGALTMVFRKKEEVDDCFTQGMKTIGIRVPDDEWILDLIKELGRPIMVTSANISGNGSLLKWEDVYASMHGRIDGIVTEDAKGEKASTIIDVSTDEIRVLREGPIRIEEIKEAMK